MEHQQIRYFLKYLHWCSLRKPLTNLFHLQTNLGQLHIHLKTKKKKHTYDRKQ